VFNNPSEGQINYGNVLDEINSFVRAEPDWKYELVVGTDSGRRDNKHVFVNQISIYRVDRGGRYFWRRSNGKSPNSIRERLIEETNQSINLAKKVKGSLKNRDYFNSINNFQVHIDVGVNGMFDKGMCNSLKSMVRNEGMEPTIKPESYGSSIIADRYV
jgi:predicted RNase H-related nuclease YkuK (DUF458 family)